MATMRVKRHKSSVQCGRNGRRGSNGHVAHRRMTVDDYMAMPDDGHRYELIDGELMMSPSSFFAHGAVQGYVFSLLREHVRRHGMGRVSLETDLVLGKDMVLRPDIVYVSRQRESIIRGHIHGAPDLAVEITSPSNWQIDVYGKKHQYEKHGVREFWVLDIVDMRFKAYQWYLRGRQYQGGLVEGHAIVSRVLKGFKLDLVKVWDVAAE
jgi:Uma2 family endonuclease